MLDGYVIVHWRILGGTRDACPLSVQFLSILCSFRQLLPPPPLYCLRLGNPEFATTVVTECTWLGAKSCGWALLGLHIMPLSRTDWLMIININNCVTGIHFINYFILPLSLNIKYILFYNHFNYSRNAIKNLRNTMTFLWNYCHAHPIFSQKVALVKQSKIKTWLRHVLVYFQYVIHNVVKTDLIFLWYHQFQMFQDFWCYKWVLSSKHFYLCNRFSCPIELKLNLLTFVTDLNHIRKENLEPLKRLIKTSAAKLGIHCDNKVKLSLTFKNCRYYVGLLNKCLFLCIVWLSCSPCHTN